MFQLKFPNKRSIDAISLQIASGEYLGAIYDLRQLLQQYPDSHQLHELLGIAYARISNSRLADWSLSIAWQGKTKSKDLYVEFGWNKYRLGKYGEAIKCFMMAKEQGYETTEILSGLINALTVSGRETEVEKPIKRLYQLAEKDLNALSHLCGFLIERGRFDEARELFYDSSLNWQSNAESLRLYAEASEYNVSDELFSRIQLCQKNHKVNANVNARMCKTIGLIAERRKNYAQAFEWIVRANNLQKSSNSYLIKTDQELFSKIKNIYLQLFGKNGSGKAETSTITHKPIFIIGMMRSGTSLLEQMLDCHTKIQGLGELEVARRWFEETFIGDKPNFSGIEHSAAKLRGSFIDQFKHLNISKPFVIDKMPANFRFVGFLAKAFPEAKFIHMKRVPQAVIWSNYKMHLNHKYYGYINDLEDLSNYYHLYLDMMNFWEGKFKNKILTVNYEDFVSVPEHNVRKILKFLSLDYEPECMSFAKSSRVVRTNSSTQIKRDVYLGSSEQWVNYRTFLPTKFLQLHHELS